MAHVTQRHTSGTTKPEINLLLWPKQELVRQSHANEILFGGAAGPGKVVRYGDSVLTPFGFRKIEKLKVGDRVCSVKGGNQVVVQLHPWQKFEEWKVSFDDGTSLSVAKGHLWQAWRASKGIKLRGSRVFGEQSKQVVETQTLKDWMQQGYTPLIPICQEQTFTKSFKFRIEIDPYLLGLLIGDGYLSDKQISITSADADHIVQVLAGHEYTHKHYHYNFKGDSRKEINKAISACHLLNTHSWDKFIPEYFKYSSIEDRYAIVQGLMDTDGYISDRDGCCYFTTVSEKLANDMAFVVRSLGGKVSISTKIPTFLDNAGKKAFGRLAYTLYIRHRKPEKLFRLQRKKEIAQKYKHQMFKRVIGIEVTGETFVGRCITVSDPEGLYITNDFTVTHNSHTLRVMGIQLATEIPNIQIYLFRRLFVDIASNHMDGPSGFRAMLAPWVRNKLVEITEEEIRWWNGSKIHLCHFQTWDDRTKYQGAEVHVALFDELTHFEERMYRWIRGRNRLGALEEQMREQIAKGEIPEWYLDNMETGEQGKFPLMFSASNPGEIGHLWVKNAFIDIAVPGQTVRTSREEGNRQRVFFPATLDDNPSIDRRYEDNLFALGDETMVRALRYGDWDILAGGFFDTFRREKHVIRPFGIPRHWPRVVAMDWGWYFPFSIGWLAYATESYQDPITKHVIPAGSIILYREWYGSEGKNRGLKMEPRLVAAKMKEISAGDPKPTGLVADSRTWNTDTGISAGTLFQDAGVTWEQAAGGPGDRVDGWRVLDQLMRSDPSQFYIFENCLDSIRQFSSAVRAQDKPEDIAKECESHALDMNRYGVVYITSGLSRFKSASNMGRSDVLTYKDLFDAHDKAVANRNTSRIVI